MKLVVCDYINGSVDIIETDLVSLQTEEVELWLQNHGYHLSSIAWMGDVKQIAFKNMKK